MLKGKTPLFIALGLGTIAFVVSYSGLRRAQANATVGWNLIPVVVAAADVSEGTEITLELLTRRSIPEQFVTSSVVSPDSASYLIGQRVLVPLQAGDPLMWSQFSSTRAAEQLSTKILQRTRALTIAASGTAAVGGWVRPNDHVDLILSFRHPESNQQVASTIMQNALVLATGQVTGTTRPSEVSGAQRTYGDVTLVVMPEEAELLVLAQQLGTITMTLRNDADLDLVTDNKHATVASLLIGERMAKAAAARIGIDVIRAGRSEQKSVELPR
jgi:pilus assembly protein CpaB